MDTTAQWQQEAGFVMKTNSMGEIMAANNACTNLKASSAAAAAAAAAAAGVALDQQQKRARPQEHLNCPRCNSTNTKFCYYNNYSLTQPRYFCKTCRRYWTEGGTLRNVPVGGGSRKNKKPSTCTTISSSPPSGSSAISKNTSIGIPDLNPPTNHLYRGQDLNLAFPPMRPNTFQYMPPTSTKSENDSDVNQNHPRFASSSPLSFMTIGANGAGQAVAAPESNNTAAYSSGFSFQEFKPGVLGFVPADGLGGRFNNYRAQDNGNGNGNGGGTILFPFGELKNGHNNEVEQHKGQGNNPTGYWSGLLGGGSW